MACNTCSKTFTLLRKEKGCPACGFSYCSNCLKHKIFIPKLKSEAKVCAKCERATKTNENIKIEPPDVYYKRIGATNDGAQVVSGINTTNPQAGSSKDQEISERLKKLKNNVSDTKQVTTEDITDRLHKLKSEKPTTSDAELQLRLANIRGVPVSTLQSKPIAVVSDSRTEQEQAEDLLKQYMEQANIDENYKDDFEGVIDNIHTRLQKLKGQESKEVLENMHNVSNLKTEDEEEILNEIIEKAKAESRLDIQVADPELEELPFCEICNENAVLRCLGCKYLFCRQCFLEHKDDDDGCDKYVPYTPPRNFKT